MRSGWVQTACCVWRAITTAPIKRVYMRISKCCTMPGRLPMVIYNIPPRAVVRIDAETMAQLAELERVVGVKDATADLAQNQSPSAC